MNRMRTIIFASVLGAASCASANTVFQADFEGWEKWYGKTIRQLKAMQNADGSFRSGHGEAYGTAMSMLALALNYRFLPIYER